MLWTRVLAIRCWPMGRDDHCCGLSYHAGAHPITHIVFNPGRTIEFKVKAGLFDHLLRQPQRFFQQFTPGESSVVEPMTQVR